MNRAHIALMIEGALNILPDPYLSDIDLDDDDVYVVDVMNIINVILND